MAEYKPQIIWYTSDRRARSCLKLCVYDDKGRLCLRGKSIEFIGLNSTCSIDTINTVGLAAQTPNWPWHVAAASTLFVLLTFRGVSVVLSAPLVLACMTIALTLGRATKWVRVTHRTDDCDVKCAWFADGSNFGWSGILGGTSRLYEVIRANMTTAESDPAETDGHGEPIVLGPPLRTARGPVGEECPWCESRVVPDADGRCPSCDRPIA